MSGDETYDFEVVGESHYEDAISRIAGPKCRDGVELFTTAHLICEHDNPYDSNAVGVYIQGQKVASLSRADAVSYRQALDRFQLLDAIAEVEAVIEGGWQRGTREWNYTIRLDISQDE